LVLLGYDAVGQGNEIRAVDSPAGPGAVTTDGAVGQVGGGADAVPDSSAGPGAVTTNSAVGQVGDPYDIGDTPAYAGGAVATEGAVGQVEYAMVDDARAIRRSTVRHGDALEFRRDVGAHEQHSIGMVSTQRNRVPRGVEDRVLREIDLWHH